MPDFDKFVAGEPEQSNWPGEYFGAYGRRTPELQKTVHYIDVDGDTMSRATTPRGAWTEAKRLQSQFPGAIVEIRPYQESEEDADRAYQEQREERWSSIVYKPLPNRRAR